MSELNYGDNVEHLLYELSQYYEDEIKGSFEIRGEDANGVEGYEYIEVSLLADDAMKLIAELKAQRDALAAKGMELCREAAHVYGKYNVTQMPDMDLVDCQTIQEFSDLADGSTSTAAYLNSVRAEVIPEGYVLVPQQMHLSADAMESLCFHCGDGGFAFGEFTDGLLWVGDIENDDGSKTYGLNIATAEYPDEGSANISEFVTQLLAGEPS